MPKRESDLIADAMAETQRERFAQAWDQDMGAHDATGDTSLERHDNEDQGRELEAADQHIGDDVAEIETETVEKPDIDGENDVVAKPDAKEKQPRVNGKFAKKDGTEAAAKPAAEEPDAKPDEHGRIPAGVVREKTKALEAKIAERDAKLADSDQRFAELNGKLELLSRQLQTRAQPQPQPTAKTETAPRPDKFSDPEGYDKWVEDQIALARSETRDAFDRRLLNINLATNFETHGEKFTAAWNAFTQLPQGNPEVEALKTTIRDSFNPGGEIMKWHRRQEALREIGEDPAAYKQKIEAEARDKFLADPEFRKEIIASIKAEAAGNAPLDGKARHVIRVPGKLPPSLNGASGAGNLTDPAMQAALNDQSDAGRFNRVWEVDPDA